MKSTNRVLLHIGRQLPCRCCRTRKLRKRLAAECRRIETLADRTIQFFLPSLAWFLTDVDERDEGEEGKPYSIRFHIAAEPNRVAMDAGFSSHVVNELRRIALQLFTAANAIEAGGESQASGNEDADGKDGGGV